MGVTKQQLRHLSEPPLPLLPPPAVPSTLPPLSSSSSTPSPLHSIECPINLIEKKAFVLVRFVSFARWLWILFVSIPSLNRVVFAVNMRVAFIFI